MAAILINPTSASFSSSGGNGSISLSVETADWHTTPQTGDIWMAQREKTNGVWSSWVVFKIVGEDGADGANGAPGAAGRGIVGTPSVSYVGSSSGTVIPSGSANWQSSPPSINPGQYLWTRIIYTYSDNTTSASYSVARYGIDGTASHSPTMVYAGYYNKNPRTGESEQMVYQGNNDVVSVVYDPYSRKYWVASSSAGGTDGTFTDSASSPQYSSNWDEFGSSFDSVATGVIFAEKGYIENAIIRQLETSSGSTKRVVIADNVITMYDDGNKQKLIVTGENLSSLSSLNEAITILAGTPIAVSNTSVKNLNGSETIWDSSIDQSNNSITLPDLSITVERGSSSGTPYVDGKVWYRIDDIDYPAASYGGSFSSGSTGRNFSNLPTGMTTTLSSGPHTIYVCATALCGTATLRRLIIKDAAQGLITYPSQQVQIGANGFRAAFSTTQYADFTKSGSADPEFTLRCGNYGFKVTSSGFKKMTDGTNWTTITL